MIINSKSEASAVAVLQDRWKNLFVPKQLSCPMIYIYTNAHTYILRWTGEEKGGEETNRKLL